MTISNHEESRKGMAGMRSVSSGKAGPNPNDVSFLFPVIPI